jgi:hypothetical protein
MGRAYLFDLERDTIRNPGLDVVRRLARAVGATPEELMGL